jgi:hypothetical protein
MMATSFRALTGTGAVRILLAYGANDIRKGFDGQAVWFGRTSAVPYQLSMLLEGIDWRRLERTWVPSLAG